MKNFVKKLTIMAGALLFILSGCGSPPEKEEARSLSSNETLERLTVFEKQKVKEFLDQAGEKINKLAREYLSSTNSSSQNQNSHPGKISDKDTSEGNQTSPSASREMTSLEEEAFHSIQKDPLFQALRILEELKFPEE